VGEAHTHTPTHTVSWQKLCLRLVFPCRGLQAGTAKQLCATATKVVCVYVCMCVCVCVCVCVCSPSPPSLSLIPSHTFALPRLRAESTANLKPAIASYLMRQLRTSMSFGFVPDTRVKRLKTEKQQMRNKEQGQRNSETDKSRTGHIVSM
jgi:hypothetical protein